MAALKNSNQARAKATWGEVPDWVQALAVACDRTSQGVVAKQLGISGAVVNQAIGNAYKGRVDRIETRVRGELMRATVLCPVIGPISTRDCLDNQKRGFRATNPLRVKLSRTCPTCTHREDACSKA